MGKTATYGIEYARTDPALEGFQFYMAQYKSLLSTDPAAASETALELTEWLVDESDDQVGLSMQFQPCLKAAIALVQRTLDRHRDTERPTRLGRAHAALSQAHLLLGHYDDAIQHALATIDLDRSLHQPTYRTLGNIYFTKSNDRDHSRADDVHRALHYYDLERSTIDPMSDSDTKQRLLQSSSFNQGVMQARLSGLYGRAESSLQSALVVAQQLEDVAAQKTAWWELGKLMVKLGRYDEAKECQANEYRIIQQHHFTSDAMYCFEEQIKLHLFLDEYEGCVEVYGEAMKQDPENTKTYKDLLEMVKRLKTMKDEIEGLVRRRDQNAPIAALYFEYVETLRDYELHRVVVKTLDEDSLNTLLNARDFDHLLYAQLLHYKTQSLWELKESSKEEYLKSSNEAFEYVEANLMTSPLDQLSLTIDIFKLRVRIHEYFDHQLQLESCKKLLSETIKEEKLLRQKLENNYLMNTMDIIPEYTRITPSIHKAFKMKIQVKVVFSSNMEAIEFKAQYERAPETVQRLLDDIATRCWIQHGIEPVLSHLRTMDHDLFPEDYLRNIITQENQPIEAYAKDIVIKQPLQIYLNACDRLKVEPVKEIKLRLTKQSSNKISFTGLNLSIQQLAPLQQVIHHSTTLQTLKLSTNMLCDEDLKLLLEGANYDRLGELVLSNNRLTSVHLLIQPFRLRSIDLSHNPIGPSFLKHLPTFLIAVPSLKLINLENTHIGHHTVIEPETQQAYEQFESHKMSAASLSIDISSNHFENDMLIQWTTLWRKLKRLSRLDMASVTSDFGWKNFDSLSDLSTLSDLGFKYSIRETLNYCRFHEFFRLKGQLNQLDLTACGLTLDDMAMLGYSLGFVSKIRRLTLNSNPNIGDQGLQLLNDVVLAKKIEVVDISDCQLEHWTVWVKWSGYLKQLNITRNPRLLDVSADEQARIENDLENAKVDTLMAMIKLDDKLKTILNSRIQSMLRLSFQSSASLLTVNSPF